MDKWTIIFLAFDIVLMGVVIILLFRVRSTAARAGSSLEKAISSSGETPSAFDAELKKVQERARNTSTSWSTPAVARMRTKSF